MAWLPEKYRVLGSDGQVDLQASAQKLGDGYAHLSKRMGAGDVPPEAASGYTVTVPEKFKADAPGDQFFAPFREKAHAAGMTQAQFDLVVGEFFELTDAGARLSADQARAELGTVWTTPDEMNTGMGNAESAVAAIPEELRAQVKERYGADPVFWQFAAYWGAQTREDRAPGSASAAPAVADVQTLMASDAYRNPKNPQHAAVSAQVQDALKRRYGDSPVTG